MQVIAHNLLSQFSNRQLNITTKDKAKTSEKLSSGYRINRSADDAAGLQISEKMRWQIRGLEKGKDNITDGVSLVQVADGALSEVHSILQRVRELSVQAYNDTNTPADRDAIQSEIEEALQEVDRIAQTTTFNTKQLLLGNPRYTVQITEDETVDQVAYMQMVKDIPSWLYVDSEMTVHESYTQAQDTTGTMLKWDGTDTGTKEYWGPEGSVGGDWEHRGTWSEDISNNPSAKVDFGVLAQVSPSAKLYSYLYDLIGTKIAFPCGTCSTQVNSVSFGARLEALATEGFENSAEIDVTGNVDLSSTPFEYNGKTYEGYFAAVQELLDIYGGNYDEDADNDIAGEDAAALALAQAIAKDLRDKTYDTLDSKMQSHFDRVVKGDDDYSLIVYDYRDRDALTDLTAADTTVKTSARVNYRIRTTVLEPGITVEVSSPMKIMCGALSSSYIDIDLPRLSLWDLGLSFYQVNFYEMMERYSDSYRDRLAAWENNATEETHTGTYMEKVVDTQTPPIYGYVNGERKLLQEGKTTYKYEERTYTYTSKNYGPKPAAGPGDITVEMTYLPDSLNLVDNAIAKVSRARSELGAIQNRLEHAYNINANTAENSQAAESQIRDMDMAEGMVEYSKHSILEQAGQSMLAQANLSAQGILSLLQ